MHKKSPLTLSLLAATFANSLDPDQADRTSGSELFDTDSVPERIFSVKFEKKRQQKHKKLPITQN